MGKVLHGCSAKEKRIVDEYLSYSLIENSVDRCLRGVMEIL